MEMQEPTYAYRPDTGFGDLLNIIREDPEYVNLNESSKEKDKQATKPEDNTDAPQNMNTVNEPEVDLDKLDLEDYDKDDFNKPGKEVPSKSKKNIKYKITDAPKTLGNQVLKDSKEEADDKWPVAEDACPKCGEELIMDPDTGDQRCPICGYGRKAKNESLYLCNNCFKTFRNTEASCTECASNIVEMIVEAKRHDRMEGGMGDKKVASDFNPQQIKYGVEIEMEHTDDPDTAREIAIDHLTEDPEYYTKLRKMEAGKCDEADMFKPQHTKGEEAAYNRAMDAKHDEESTAIDLYKKYRSQGMSREESIHQAVKSLKRRINHEELRNIILKHGIQEAVKNSKIKEAHLKKKDFVKLVRGAHNYGVPTYTNGYVEKILGGGRVIVSFETSPGEKKEVPVNDDDVRVVTASESKLQEEYPEDVVAKGVLRRAGFTKDDFYINVGGEIKPYDEDDGPKMVAALNADSTIKKNFPGGAWYDEKDNVVLLFVKTNESKLQENDTAALQAKKQEIEQKMLDAEKAYQEEQNRMGAEVDAINQQLRDKEEAD